MPSQELAEAFAFFRRFSAPPGATLAELRSVGERRVREMPLFAGAWSAAMSAGGVPGEWVSVEGIEPAGCILFLHGGGYVLGSPGTNRDLVARLCQASKARALSLDYRLAPEHPFPAAVEDSVAAYRWLLEQGISPGSCAFAGGSAGGGLVVWRHCWRCVMQAIHCPPAPSASPPGPTSATRPARSA